MTHDLLPMTDQLRNEALAAIAACDSSAALEEQRVALLGKKGRLTEELKKLGAADAETRKNLGAALNQTKDAIAAALESRKAELAASELNARLASETIDITLPARNIPPGRIHPVT